jgi:hypothetical protein
MLFQIFNKIILSLEFIYFVWYKTINRILWILFYYSKHVFSPSPLMLKCVNVVWPYWNKVLPMLLTFEVREWVRNVWCVWSFSLEKMGTVSLFLSWFAPTLLNLYLCIVDLFLGFNLGGPVSNSIYYCIGPTRVWFFNGKPN